MEVAYLIGRASIPCSPETQCHHNDIAKQLGMNYMVLVFDEAIYSKAQHIRWENAEFMEKLIIRMEIRTPSCPSVVQLEILTEMQVMTMFYDKEFVTNYYFLLLLRKIDSICVPQQSQPGNLVML